MFYEVKNKLIKQHQKPKFIEQCSESNTELARFHSIIKESSQFLCINPWTLFNLVRIQPIIHDAA